MISVQIRDLLSDESRYLNQLVELSGWLMLRSREDRFYDDQKYDIDFTQPPPKIKRYLTEEEINKTLGE